LDKTLYYFIWDNHSIFDIAMNRFDSAERANAT